MPNVDAERLLLAKETYPNDFETPTAIVVEAFNRFSIRCTLSPLSAFACGRGAGSAGLLDVCGNGHRFRLIPIIDAPAPAQGVGDGSAVEPLALRRDDC